MYPTLLPYRTNTLLPLHQRAHPTQCPPSPTTTNTFTLYHQPTITHTHQHPRHRDIHLLRRQQEWVAQPVAPWHPLHPIKHRSPPTRHPKHMAPTPQTPQPFELSPPTNTHHSSNHQHIYTFHQVHPLLVATLPPRHAGPRSLHRH